VSAKLRGVGLAPAEVFGAAKVASARATTTVARSAQRPDCPKSGKRRDEYHGQADRGDAEYSAAGHRADLGRAEDSGRCLIRRQERVPRGLDVVRRAIHDPDVRFLVTEEVEALLRAVPDDSLGRVERVMYLTAAMTGMRQGELFALRWRDVDWSARRIRVRRNFVRGEFGTPKSKRSSRSSTREPRRDRTRAAVPGFPVDAR
jgi:integrase